MQKIDWTAANPERNWLPAELLSMTGLAQWKKLSVDQQRRLSQIEFARLCAAGLWLEGLLIGRTASAGYGKLGLEETRVVLQEVREEAGHGLMFLEMIERAGLAGVSLLGDTRLLSWVANRLNADSAAYWAMVYLGESVTDNFALRVLRSHESEILPRGPAGSFAASQRRGPSYRRGPQSLAGAGPAVAVAPAPASLGEPETSPAEVFEGDALPDGRQFAAPGASRPGGGRAGDIPLSAQARLCGVLRGAGNEGAEAQLGTPGIEPENRQGPFASRFPGYLFYARALALPGLKS